mmetsp:Transcript_39168/g.103378  ORF Transcript_39168/g.103378 Transcript_39168/m.103378 type:complete len:245 (-) Transcript_39168:39-773(-)
MLRAWCSSCWDNSPSYCLRLLGRDPMRCSRLLCKSARPCAHAVMGLQLWSSSPSSPPEAAAGTAPLTLSWSSTVAAGGATGAVLKFDASLSMGTMSSTARPRPPRPRPLAALLLAAGERKRSTAAACCQVRKSWASKHLLAVGPPPAADFEAFAAEAPHDSPPCAEAAAKAPPGARRGSSSWRWARRARYMRTWLMIWYTTVRPISQKTKPFCLISEETWPDMISKSVKDQLRSKGLSCTNGGA